MDATYGMLGDRCDGGRALWAERVGLPSYGVTEAARLLGMRAETLGRWHLPSRGARGGTVPALLAPRVSRRGLSYLDLIEAVVVKGLRDSGMPANHVRKAYAYLQEKTGLDHPFARMELEREGWHIFYGLYLREGGEWGVVTAEATCDGQVVIRGMIADGIRPLWKPEAGARIHQLIYDERLGMTVRWYPRGRDFPVMVDPRFGFGVPVLEASRIPTSILAERRRAGATIREIADDFAIPETQVHWALMFEGAEERLETA